MMDSFFHYWLGNGRILGSEDPGVRAWPERIIEPMRDEHGVTHMLSLVQPGDDYSRFSLVHRVLPVHHLPDQATLLRGHAFMDFALRGSGKVWVHCSRGMDRTGVMIGTYLVRNGTPPGAAVATFRGLFAHRIPPRRFDSLWADAIALIHSFGSP